MSIATEKTVVIDYKLKKQFKTITFLQYDTNIINFVVEDNGEIADLSDITKIVVNFKRPDRQVVSRKLTAEGNKILYQLTDLEMAKSGDCQLALQLFGEGERLTVAVFKVTITESIEINSTPTIDESRYIVQLLEETRDSFQNAQLFEVELQEMQASLAYRVKTINGISPDEQGNVNIAADLESILQNSENLINPEKRKDGFSLAFSYRNSTTESYNISPSQITHTDAFDATQGDVIYSNAPGRLVWYTGGGLVDGNASLVLDSALGLYKATIGADAVKFKLDAYLSNILTEGYWFVCKSVDYGGTKYPFGTKKLKSEIKSDAFADKAEVRNLTREIESLKGSDSVTFFIPSTLYCYASNRSSKWINLESVLTGHDVHSYYIDNTAPGGFLRDFERVEAQNAGQITIRDKRTNSSRFTRNYQTRSIDPSTKTNPSTLKNVLIIGDSLSAAGFIPCDVKRQITVEYGFANFNFIGTVSDTVNGITCLNEGRGGYSLTDFTKTNDTQGRGGSYPNPFLNNGIVSMSNYMSRNSFTGNLDYCIIELGVNNLVGLSQNATTIKSELKKLVDQILASYPNCEIFVCGIVPISKINGEKSYAVHNTEVLNINKAYEEFCLESAYLNKCFYVDTGVFFDNYAGYPMINSPYRGSNLERLVVTDWLHPSEAGYYMMADTIASAFIYHM